MCLVYMNDIIIVGHAFENHLGNIWKVLEKLRMADLKLNLSKCKLFCCEVNYLGHIISVEGVQTDPEKISVVENWSCPEDQNQLRSFLGICTHIGNS